MGSSRRHPEFSKSFCIVVFFLCLFFLSFVQWVGIFLLNFYKLSVFSDENEVKNGLILPSRDASRPLTSADLDPTTLKHNGDQEEVPSTNGSLETQEQLSDNDRCQSEVLDKCQSEQFNHCNITSQQESETLIVDANHSHEKLHCEGSTQIKENGHSEDQSNYSQTPNNRTRVLSNHVNGLDPEEKEKDESCIDCNKKEETPISPLPPSPNNEPLPSTVPNNHQEVALATASQGSNIDLQAPSPVDPGDSLKEPSPIVIEPRSGEIELENPTATSRPSEGLPALKSLPRTGSVSLNLPNLSNLPQISAITNNNNNKSITTVTDASKILSSFLSPISVQSYQQALYPLGVGAALPWLANKPPGM